MKTWVNAMMREKMSRRLLWDRIALKSSGININCHVPQMWNELNKNVDAKRARAMHLQRKRHGKKHVFVAFVATYAKCHGSRMQKTSASVCHIMVAFKTNDNKVNAWIEWQKLVVIIGMEFSLQSGVAGMVGVYISLHYSGLRMV